jgi:hypothetical protein
MVRPRGLALGLDHLAYGSYAGCAHHTILGHNVLGGDQR